MSCPVVFCINGRSLLAPHGHRALATLPASTLGLCTCVSMETPVSAPLVRTSFLHLPSLGGGTATLQPEAPPSISPRLPWLCVLPGRAVAQPRQNSPLTLLLSRPLEQSSLSPAHREGDQAPACLVYPQYVPPQPGSVDFLRPAALCAPLPGMALCLCLRKSRAHSPRWTVSPHGTQCVGTSEGCAGCPHRGLLCS